LTKGRISAKFSLRKAGWEVILAVYDLRELLNEIDWGFGVAAKKTPESTDPQVPTDEAHDIGTEAPKTKRRKHKKLY
jgi:hypothetical protein